MGTKKVYCPSCGVEVEAVPATYQGKVIWQCPICGLILEEDETSLSTPKILERVVVAEDSETVANLIKKVLINKKYSKDVTVTSNGVEFISAITELFKNAEPIDLVILDVEMPILNGIQAALSLRELEKKAGRRKIPILFFTGRSADEKFKLILKRLQPSSYVNKGTSQNPMDLMKRMEKVMKILLQSL